MAQPELGGSEFEHGEEVCGVLFVSGGEPVEVFDAVEEPLDAVARPVAVRYFLRLKGARPSPALTTSIQRLRP